MFKCVKAPKNLCQFRLFRGAADFGNLQQWDLYEKGYSFLTVVTVPRFIDILAKQGPANMRNIASRLLNNFVYVLEHEFKGLTGLSNLTAQTSEITDGISSVQMINKVEEDTSITIQMSFVEKSGRTLTKFCELFLRGIKDTRTQGKTYWGLIEMNLCEAGFENEVFSLLYYITDNTYRTLEGAYLFMCAQITEVPLTDVFESQKGEYSYPEINLSFNCFPVTDDSINEEAARMLDFLLSEDAGYDRLIVDTQSCQGYYTGEKDLKNAYGMAVAGNGGKRADYTSNWSADGKNNYASTRNKHDVAGKKEYMWT